MPEKKLGNFDYGSLRADVLRANADRKLLNTLNDICHIFQKECKS